MGKAVLDRMESTVAAVNPAAPTPRISPAPAATELGADVARLAGFSMSTSPPRMVVAPV